ncbi:MAG: tellurite resistance TerB family protein [Nitrococcus mobilis]|nr:tellurite resistance TerB family protein [Nitrococcus mobilis]
MSLGNVIGQLLQQGMASQSRSKLERAVGPQGLGGTDGGTLEQMLGGLLGGQAGGRNASGGALDGLMNTAKDFLGNQQAGGLTGGQVGGIGALAGALLGGGGGAAKGAIGGSAMAILGALAIKALQSRGNATSAHDSSATESLPQQQLETLTAPETERLLIRAMISAAKADGQISQQEMDKILGKIGSDGVTDEDRQLVIAELSRPMDLPGLVSEVPDETVAAEVYAASLLAIDVDTQAERSYLRQLAQALNLDAETVDQLHQMTGSPAV